MGGSGLSEPGSSRPPPPGGGARHRLLRRSKPRTDRRSSTAGLRHASNVCTRPLRQRGLELQDLRHLLLSHIHLDHAGAAGVLVREHPTLQVHVSEIGAPHLADPSRLEASARRLYGDAFDTLWGELAPVPRAEHPRRGTDVLGLECFPSPGHASHHVCYLAGDGTLYAGDAAGVRLQPDRTVLPPTPPPEFDLEAWNRTIDEIEKRRPSSLRSSTSASRRIPGRISPSSGSDSQTGRVGSERE